MEGVVWRRLYEGSCMEGGCREGVVWRGLRKVPFITI